MVCMSRIGARWQELQLMVPASGVAMTHRRSGLRLPGLSGSISARLPAEVKAASPGLPTRDPPRLCGVAGQCSASSAAATVSAVGSCPSASWL